MKRFRGLIITILSFTFIGNIYASTTLSDLYKIPPELNKNKTHQSILTHQFFKKNITQTNETIITERYAEYQVIDTTPLKEEIIARNFVQATKTFYWSDIL